MAPACTLGPNTFPDSSFDEAGRAPAGGPRDSEPDITVDIASLDDLCCVSIDMIDHRGRGSAKLGGRLPPRQGQPSAEVWILGEQSSKCFDQLLAASLIVRVLDRRMQNARLARSFAAEAFMQDAIECGKFVLPAGHNRFSAFCR
jgi:hypothetical protein